MALKLLAQARISIAPLTGYLSALQARLDRLLAPTGAMPGEAPRQGGLPVWNIVVIAVGVVLCLIPICIVIVLAILTLLGPSIGNTFGFGGMFTD